MANFLENEEEDQLQPEQPVARQATFGANADIGGLKEADPKQLVRDTIMQKYSDMFKQGREDQAAAQKKADRNNKIGGIADAIAQAATYKERAATGDKVDIGVDGLKAEGAAKVAATRAKNKEDMDHLLMQDKLGWQDVERGQKQKDWAHEDKARGREDALYDPTSTASVAANSMGLGRAQQLRNEALKAGDREGAAQLEVLMGELKAGKYSAKDINDLKILDKMDYKDVLNNQAAMARIQAQESGANKRAEMADKRAGVTSTRDLFNQESKIKQEIRLDPEIRSATDLSRSYDLMASSAKGNNGVSDEALLMFWQKTLDPSSVVRESEFARTAQGQSVLRQIETKIASLAKGERMTPQMKQELMLAAKGLRDTAAERGKHAQARYDRTVQDFGMSPDRVLPWAGAAPEKPVTPAAEAAVTTQPAPAQTVNPPSAEEAKLLQAYKADPAYANRSDEALLKAIRKAAAAKQQSDDEQITPAQ